MKKFSTLLLFLLSSQILLAQQSDRRHLVGFNFTPTALLNFGKPSLLVGVEIFSEKNTWLSV